MVTRHKMHIHVAVLHML